MILDAPACAALLRCSPAHLNKLAREGHVPAVKVGRGWVFVEDDIVEWLRVKSVAERVPRKIGRPRKRML